MNSPFSIQKITTGPRKNPVATTYDSERKVGMTRNIGVVLEQERMRAKVSLKALCQGVCSVSELNRIRNGEREPDKFLLDRLWGRLGKGMEKLEVTLSDSDYAMYELRNLISQALEEKCFEKLEKYLSFYESMEEGKKPLQQQYLFEIRAIRAFLEGEEAAAAKELKKAILCTMPDFPEETVFDFALSVEELRLLFLYLKTEKEIEIPVKIAACHQILTFLAKEYIEKEEKARLYPQVVLELSKLTGQKLRLKKEVRYALELLQEKGRFFHLVEILSLLLEILEEKKDKSEEKELLEKELFYLEKLCEEYNIAKVQPFWADFSEREFYLDYELLQKSRAVKEISQEELSEEICSQESLSRIETSKRKARANTFRQLAKRLGKRGERCGACIDAEDYEILKLERMEGKYISYGRYEKAEEIFERIREYGLKETEENRQFLILKQTIFQIKKKEITYADSILKLQEALDCTLSREEQEKIESCFLTCQEATVLNNMAIGYYRMGEKERAIRLLKSIIKNFENSRVDLRYHTRALQPVFSNLASYLEETGDYDGSLAVCKRATGLAFQVGRADDFQRYITTKACVLEDQRKTDESIECFTQAFYISSLMKDEVKAELIKNYVKGKYEVDLR